MLLRLESLIDSGVEGCIYLEIHEDFSIRIELTEEWGIGIVDVTSDILKSGATFEDIRSVLLSPVTPFWEVRALSASEVPIACVPISEEAPHSIRRAIGLNKRKSNGKGIRVGIIDRGFRRTPTTPNLTVFNLDGTQQFPVNGVYDSGELQHGAMVASVLGAQSDREIHQGVAPECSMIGVILPWLDEDSGEISASNISDAIFELVLNHEVDIINISGGFSRKPYYHDEFEQQEIDDLISSIQAAVLLANNRGVLVVAAAGNYPERSIQYPAALTDVVSIGGVCVSDLAPEGTCYSNCQSTSKNQYSTAKTSSGFSFFLDTDTTIDPDVNYYCPSRLIMSIDGTTLFEYIGTSFAAPAACGMLASELATNDTFSSLSAPKKVRLMRNKLDHISTSLDFSDFSGNVKLLTLNG